MPLSQAADSTGTDAPQHEARAAPSRAVSEHTFRTHDGVDLFYRRWPAGATAPRGAVVMLHRGHEHSGRLDHLPAELDLPDFDFYAWDARGHGRSPGPRGYAPSFATSIRDVQTFVDHIATTYRFSIDHMAIVAQSVGAVAAAAWVHDYAPNLRALVLASPAFEVKLYVPLALPGLRALRAVRGNFFVTSYVKPKLLTHDLARIASYKCDPLIARAISVNILLELRDTSDRIVADAHAITVPTQLLISGRDWVVAQGPQHTFFDRLGSPIKEKHVLEGFLHDTLGEQGRARALTQVRRFVLAQFAVTPHPINHVHDDARGFTRDEADRLTKPLSALSPRGVYWSATRASLRVGGWLSQGVALGHATGFDSGSTLDYVYRNAAAGKTFIGRLIDRTYLDSIGWRGIRQRKLHVEELLREATRRLRDRRLPVRIVDVAAGSGRYTLEAFADTDALPDAIVLRDYDDRNLREAAALAQQKHLGDMVRTVKADAFDRKSLAGMSPRPTIGIASGIYELVSDNTQVGRSLAGLGDAIAPGGFLIYTCQPWHPQLELIARSLTSHRGGPWVMRRRTQAEMDQLVARAGFRKIAQRVDQWGIFTAALAVREG